MINYDHEDGVSVSSSKLTSSVLTVRNATQRHGGNYTCAPANARQSSIYVHVLKGEFDWDSNIKLICQNPKKMSKLPNGNPTK